jgi:hypothetical protein
VTDPGPARRRLDELSRQLDEALEDTDDYPIIHLANATHPDDEPLDLSSERTMRRRVRRLEREVARWKLATTVCCLALLSTWVVLWQNW